MPSVLTVRLNDIPGLVLYTDHTGNERHLRRRERKKRESPNVCGEWSVVGWPKAFTTGQRPALLWPVRAEMGVVGGFSL